MPSVLPPDAQRTITAVCEQVGLALRHHHEIGSLRHAGSDIHRFVRNTLMRDYRTMARRTYSIHLRVNLDNDEQFDAIRTAVRNTAKRLLTQASLVSPRPPDIAIESEDFFEGTEEINLDDDEAG